MFEQLDPMQTIKNDGIESANLDEDPVIKLTNVDTITLLAPIWNGNREMT